ncbi:TPR Domain containing protein [Reticulomyxa filosa]|uniref:TPR Domain containing protein n=1 Tax=Reticulomyxa filosa TaxID=46433 RepID=X6NEJ5_RETFI|nr:TPR Domain containing protein [Reticulomyxa filosa]|eukprot:ETO24318.1 TPR Domain containing protein [Reticulomyxa filosa]
MQCILQKSILEHTSVVGGDRNDSFFNKSTKRHTDKSQLKAALLSSLELAKQACKKERELISYRDKHQLSDQINYDLTVAVLFNLAYTFELNDKFQEALNTYQSMITEMNKQQMIQVNRFRVNMGNIYYKQGKYTQAIKMYRMALDYINPSNNDTNVTSSNLNNGSHHNVNNSDHTSQGNNFIKTQLTRNIANCFIQLKQFGDAIKCYENVFEHWSKWGNDPYIPYNLIICYYALNDKEKMKYSFLQLLKTKAPKDSSSATAITTTTTHGEDTLSLHSHKRWLEIIHLIQMSAQVIAPVIGDSLNPFHGYDWILAQISDLKSIQTQNHNANNANTSAEETQSSAHYECIFESSKYNHLLDKLLVEITVAKGIAFLKAKQVQKAIEVFKGLENESGETLEKAATNLSFVYFLESEFENANMYAEKAVSLDRYNACALVNRANCLVVLGEFEQAKEMYLEAIGVEADCTEAIFNLGLVCEKLQHYNDALQAFHKLHRLCPKDAYVLLHIAKLFCDYSFVFLYKYTYDKLHTKKRYDLNNDTETALEYYRILQGLVPNDAGVYLSIGNLYRKKEDEIQTFHNYLDSHKCLSNNLDVILWLGVWYVESQMYEKAIDFFNKASQIEPNQLKWKLMIASCYKKMQNYAKAILTYQSILAIDPTHIKCLQDLCAVLKKINDPTFDTFNAKLIELQMQQQTNVNKNV